MGFAANQGCRPAHLLGLQVTQALCVADQFDDVLPLLAHLMDKGAVRLLLGSSSGGPQCVQLRCDGGRWPPLSFGGCTTAEPFHI